jgi:lambda family phage portal protein
VIEPGEALIRRRWRRPEDNLPIPLQLQVLEPDYLDTAKDGQATGGGGRIIQGVEFDGIGRRVAYWLLPEHPGANLVGAGFGASQRIPASEILHVFEPGRPGAARGVTWLGNVMLRLKDFDDYEDAALMKQKIAACLAVLTTDVDGTMTPLGTSATNPNAAAPDVDTLEPGMILNIPPGRDVSVVSPPSVSEHEAYARTVLRAIATGLGLTYEDLTGDYSQVNFSSARMARLRHWARVEGWRWNLLVPQLCDPVWRWAMQAAAIVGLEEIPGVEWTAPPAPMIDPEKEGLAAQRLLRIGGLSWAEWIRERGYDPDQVLAEIAETNAKLDKLGIILDCDPRHTSQQGQPRETAKSGGTADDEQPADSSSADERISRNGARR